MKSILVTGGCGYIGSHIVVSLLEKGYRVYIIDSHYNSSPKVIERLKTIISNIDKNLLENLNYFFGDIRLKDDLENIFIHADDNNQNIDSVIHCAGLKSVNQSITEPLLYWETNLCGTINLLKVMKKYSCYELIFSSSACVYSSINNNKLDENSLIGPSNPYGYTKSTIEKILENLFLSEPNKWRISSLRYFNPIGAHNSGLIGENPSGKPNNIFPSILLVASKKIKHLEIYGNDWPSRDGTCVRDYIHILDLADGHIMALEKLFKSKPNIINLNLGTGKSTTILELIKCFERVNKIKIPYVFTNRRDGDMWHLVANNSLAANIFKWSPQRSLEEMCVDGWRWQKMNPNGYE